MRKNAAYLFLLVLLTLPLSLGWLLNMAAGNLAPRNDLRPTLTFELPVVSTSLGGADGAVATVRATLVLHSASQLPRIQQTMPKLLDGIAGQLHELPSADPERRHALAGLRTQLLARLNGVLAPEKLDDLLLTEVTIR